MTKHGRNSTANPVYSYHERKRDSKESCFGTIERRIGGDSMQKIDHCSLTNQKCEHPVVTKQGYIYDKESIIKYILKQKEIIRNKHKSYEKELKKAKLNKEKSDLEQSDLKKAEFIRSEGFAHKTVGKSKQSTSLHSAKTDLPCFWIPTLAPECEETAEKPQSLSIPCPFSGKPLKISKMSDVNFTYAKDSSDILICAASGDTITTSTPCAVLLPSGKVVTMQYVEKIIKSPGDSYMKCPFSGKTLENDDIIPLKCGGSWFSASGESHTGKIITPAMLIS